MQDVQQRGDTELILQVERGGRLVEQEDGAARMRVGTSGDLRDAPRR